MVLTVGLTVVAVCTVVNAASLYHFNVPVEQVALKTAFEPKQSGFGIAAAVAGEFGVAVTVTVICSLGPKQPLLSHLT